MTGKTLVLVSEQQIEEPRIDILAFCRQPPASLRRGIRPEQAPLAIEDRRRIGKLIPNRSRSERGNPPAGGERRNEYERRKSESEVKRAPQSNAHLHGFRATQLDYRDTQLRRAPMAMAENRYCNKTKGRCLATRSGSFCCSPP